MNKLSNQPVIKPSAGGLYGWSIKKHLGIAGIFAFLMFLAMPVINALSIFQNYILRYTSQPIIDFNDTEVVFYISEVFFIPVCIIFNIVLACMLFSYMHSKVSTDAFHSLPIKRSTLFLSRYFAGITLINIPAIIMIGLTIAIHAISAPYLQPGQLSFESISYMLEFLVMFVLTQTAFFTMTAFVSVNTGTLIDMILSLLSINAAWPLMFLMFDSFFDSMLYGYTSIIDFEAYFLLSPLLRMALSSFEFGLFPILWFIAFTILLLLASIFMYKRRKSESTGKPFSFPAMKYILLVIIPVIVGMVLGNIFQLFIPNRLVFLLGFILGSFAAHTIVEVIVSRGFKRFVKSLIIYAITAVVFFIFFTATYLGLFGYETKAPDLGDIDGVKISILSSYDSDGYLSDSYIQPAEKYGVYDLNYKNAPDLYLTGEDAKDTILKLHHSIIDNIPYSRKAHPGSPMMLFAYNTVYNESYANSDNMTFLDCETIVIEYRLKNGMSQTRKYSVACENFSQFYNALRRNLEYNQKYNIAFNLPDKPLDVPAEEASQHFIKTGEPSFEGYLSFEVSSDELSKQKYDVIAGKDDVYKGGADYFDSTYVDEYGDTVYVHDGIEYYYNEEFDEYYAVYNYDDGLFEDLTHEQALELMDAYKADLTDDISSGNDDRIIGTLIYTCSSDIFLNIKMPIKASYKRILNLDYVQNCIPVSNPS